MDHLAIISKSQMILNKTASIAELKGLFPCIKHANKCANREDLFGIQIKVKFIWDLAVYLETCAFLGTLDMKLGKVDKLKS